MVTVKPSLCKCRLQNPGVTYPTEGKVILKSKKYLWENIIFSVKKMGLWQETTFLMVSRGRSHLDEITSRWCAHCLVLERSNSANKSALQISQLSSVLWHWNGRLQSRQVICFQENSWNDENVKRWEHFLASSSGSSPGLSWHSGNQGGHSCSVPRQHGPALSQGDKRLLATLHLPTRVMNILWPWRFKNPQC